MELPVDWPFGGLCWAPHQLLASSQPVPLLKSKHAHLLKNEADFPTECLSVYAKWHMREGIGLTSACQIFASKWGLSADAEGHLKIAKDMRIFVPVPFWPALDGLVACTGLGGWRSGAASVSS